MMTPKTQSTNEDIRATIQQMAADIQELKQNRQFNTHSSEDTHRLERTRTTSIKPSYGNSCPSAHSILSNSLIG
jgi:hypothetical protein